MLDLPQTYVVPLKELHLTTYIPPHSASEHTMLVELYHVIQEVKALYRLAYFVFQINLLLCVFLYNLINQLFKLPAIVDSFALRTAVRGDIFVHIKDRLNDTALSHRMKEGSYRINCLFRFCPNICRKSRENAEINVLATAPARLNCCRCNVPFPCLNPLFDCS